MQVIQWNDTLMVHPQLSKKLSRNLKRATPFINRVSIILLFPRPMAKEYVGECQKKFSVVVA